MVLANKTALIVVFRGTRQHRHALLDRAEVVLINRADFWTDSQFLPAVCRVGGRVHSGFLSAFRGYQRPARRDRAGQATRAEALADGPQPGRGPGDAGGSASRRDGIQGLYAYGCPHVGDAAFARVLPERSYFRFVHRDDWVATVPPELLGYVHAGELQQVPGSPPRSLLGDLASGAAGLNSALAEMVRDLRLDAGLLPFKVSGLADHVPIYYATLLWNALLPCAADGRHRRQVSVPRSTPISLVPKMVSLHFSEKMVSLHFSEKMVSLHISCAKEFRFDSRGASWSGWTNDAVEPSTVGGPVWPPSQTIALPTFGKPQPRRRAGNTTRG